MIQALIFDLATLAGDLRRTVATGNRHYAACVLPNGCHVALTRWHGDGGVRYLLDVARHHAPPTDGELAAVTAAFSVPDGVVWTRRVNAREKAVLCVAECGWGEAAAWGAPALALTGGEAGAQSSGATARQATCARTRDR